MEYSSKFDELYSANSSSFTYQFHWTLEDFMLGREKKERCTQNCMYHLGGCPILWNAARILRTGLVWKRCPIYPAVPWLVGGFSFPPLWPRFQVSEKVCCISEYLSRIGADLYINRLIHLFVNNVDRVQWKRDTMRVYSWIVNDIVENLNVLAELRFEVR